MKRKLPRALGSLLRRTTREEAGITIIEVVIAAVILAIGGLAVLGLVNAASHNNFRTEQSQVVNDRLQQEMEALKQLPYSQVALSGLPAHANDADNPNNRVSGAQFNVNRSGTPNNEGLVYNGGTNQEGTGAVGGGTVNPGPIPFTSGDVKGNLYHYVTWAQDPSCGNCNDRWTKHVVVAATLDQTAPGGARAYQEIQGNLFNPDAGANQCVTGSSGCPAHGGTDETPWTFWLTDTSCNNSTRQAISADHATHNTLDVCSKGTKTGPPTLIPPNLGGAPDLMFTQATPCVNGGCDNSQPQFDYAGDVEPGCGTLNCNVADKGLQESLPTNLVNGGSGCLTNLGGVSSLLSLGSNPQTYMHKWVSPQIPSGFNVTLDGNGELDLWTQTINNAVHPGRICVWLFTRHLDGITGLPIDDFAVNVGATCPSGQANCCPTNSGLSLTYFQCSFTSWPHGGWSEIHIPLHYTLTALSPGYRLGVAIAVERSGTLPGTGLQFMYDHPSFDSRLEVQTRSLLPTF